MMLTPARAARGPICASRARIDIAGDDLALVSHVRRQRQRLAARARRKIEDALAGPRVCKQCRDLRRFILEFERALFEHVVLPQRREAFPDGMRMANGE